MKHKHYFILIVLLLLTGMLSFSIDLSAPSPNCTCEETLSPDSQPLSLPAFTSQDALPAAFLQFHHLSLGASFATQRSMSRIVSIREQLRHFNFILQVRRFQVVTSYCQSLRKISGYYILGLRKLRI